MAAEAEAGAEVGVVSGSEKLYSLGEAASEVGKPYHWVHRWARRKGLGVKVGWGVVMSRGEVEVLRELATRGGSLV